MAFVGTHLCARSGMVCSKARCPHNLTADNYFFERSFSCECDDMTKGHMCTCQSTACSAMAQTELSMVVAHRESTHDNCVALIKMHNTSNEQSTRTVSAVYRRTLVATVVSQSTGLLPSCVPCMTVAIYHDILMHYQRHTAACMNDANRLRSAVWQIQHDMREWLGRRRHRCDGKRERGWVHAAKQRPRVPL